MSELIKRALVAVVITALTTLPGEAWGYRLTEDFAQGFYWAGFPIQLNKFATSTAEGELLASLLNQAENAWEDAVGREIWQADGGAVISNDFYGNNIRWSNNFAADTGYNPSSTLAVTIRYSSGTHVQKTEIILNGELFYLRQNQNNILYKTILHELGHTIGLDHSDQPAIMGASVSHINSLQSDDEEGANAVISEALTRQATGYISPLAAQQSQDENALSACGSVDMGNSGGPGGGFFASLLLGLLLSGLSSLRRRQI